MIDPLGVVGVVLAEKFRVDRLLGEGGFGIVYAGFHTVLGEPIAVKFIKVEGLTTDPARAAAEFLREARILFSLSHPAIVRMYDVGALERGPLRVPWVVLELLSGPTLAEEITERRRQGRHWSAAELRDIFDPILDGLAFAHGRGIMHRDVKPSNILLSRAASGALEPKLVDFGTARTQLSVFETSMGKTGFTPLYGAPEQWNPTIGPPTAATDVYALGLTLLECATLQRPHGAADSLPAIMRAVMGGPAGAAPLATLRPDLPPALGAVIARTLSVQPTERFRDANELRAAMRAALAATSPAASSFGPMPLVPFVPSAPAPTTALPVPTYRTTAPFTQITQTPTVAPQPQHVSPRLGIVAVVIAAVALVVVLGVATVAGTLYLRGAPARTGDGSSSTSTPFGGPPPISAPNVGASTDFDRTDAVTVTHKNQPAIAACAAKSHRFNGTIDVVVEVSASDGRVVGTTCQTVWPSHDSKHPKLDPEAAELCACIETVTPSWRFKPPKADIVTPLFEDTQSLHIKYVCAK
jgi:eukaryotic-like serine/threonine-protein kinase